MESGKDTLHLSGEVPERRVSTSATPNRYQTNQRRRRSGLSGLQQPTLTSNPAMDNNGVQMSEKRRRSSCPVINLESAVNVKRAAQTQVQFDELHLKQQKDEKPPLKDRVCSQVYCDKKRSWKILTSYIPVVRYIRYYKLKEFAVPDVFAGLTVGILHIPQALAFGALTSVKVENGLFTSVWPVLLYVLFGTSAHVSMGTSAVICILTAATVDRLGQNWAAERPWLTNMTSGGVNGTAMLLDEVPEYLDYKEEIAMGVAFVSGLMMIGLGLFKLGFITFYLSESFFTAFTSAAAVHIGTSQMSSMLGLKIERFAGVGKIIYTYEAIFSVITTTNIAALIIAVTTCVVIQLVKDCINERFKHKLFAPIPIELFVVIFATVVSYFGEFADQFGVDVVGTFPNTIPPPRVPMRALQESPKFVVDAFILAILIFANTIAMAKICAKKHNYEVDDSQELIAYGMCNAVSSFFLCFPSSVAPPRSMVASNMNARTTLCGVFSAAVMVCVILFIGPLFVALPKSALSAIIFISLKGLFVQILDGRKFWKINKFDFVIWFFTFFATVFLDIDVGLGVGVAVSLITVVFQTQFARGYRLGKVAKDNVFVEAKRYTDASEIPGLRIFRFESNLYFANAEIFRNSLYSKTINPRKLLKFLKKREEVYEKETRERIAQGLAPQQRRNSVMTGENLLVNQRPSVVTLATSDSAGSLTQLAAEKKRKVSASSMDNAAYTIDENRAGFSRLQQDKSDKSDKGKSKSQDSLSGGINGRGNPGRKASLESSISIGTLDDEEVDDYGEVVISDEKLKRMRRVHHVIIDCSPINYMDASGSNVLCHIFSEYAHVHVQVFLAGVSAAVRRAMKHAGAFDKIPHENFFLEVSDAVAVAKTKQVEALSQAELEDFSDEEAEEDSYVTKM
ncbi:prestin-like isoform X1 [Littorina saxatilis]|uniref:prestin-like isoform X1 n=2 Tax=Littorina saxatilis TaxID=31220 RepID=UPI0038B5FA07